ncbi:MAG: nucleic acid-binding protein [Actinomycetia bacterium]|nr:nucleic acid-binding protein [Actinomycetes bacterium]
MEAESAVQANLAQIAAIDTQTTQTERRKVALPEHAELAGLSAQRTALHERVVGTQTHVSDARAELARLESDLDVAKTRLDRDQKRLDGGVATDAKQVASLQAEIEHLTGRVTSLEDDSLGVMQTIEDDEAALAAMARTREGIETQMRASIARRDEQLGEADAVLADLARQRAELASTVPADVMALYTKVAARLGTGAANLKDGRCTGCGLQLDAVALRAATDAPPSAIVRCDECGRILVRAA